MTSAPHVDKYRYSSLLRDDWIYTPDECFVLPCTDWNVSSKNCDRISSLLYFWGHQRFQGKYPSDHAVAYEERILIANYVNADLDRC